MSKKNNYKPKQQTVAKENKPQNAAKPKSEKPKTAAKFAGKCLLFLAAVIIVVIYTDKKEYFVGDQTNNHVQRKWRSFYRFTDVQHKNVDILVLGNSHASAGVEPFIVSAATGTNCFILNTPGASINDMYFNLKEVLRHTKPKLVILETFCVYGGEMGLEWGRIQSFEAKRGIWNRLQYMPFLFSSDEWLKAWSPTLRNHSFLLTDTARIAFNKKYTGVEKNPDRTPLDLGRFSHGSNYMKDSTLAKYDLLGAPMKCEEKTVIDINQKYLKKLHDLCRKNDIQLMLLSVPMLPKVFSDYNILKEKQLAVYSQYPAVKWLDLQQPYDSARFTAQAYNDEYSSALHTTFYGMTVTAYKLAEFLMQNYADILPDRSRETLWINDFWSTDHFLYNQDGVAGMPNYTSIAKDVKIGQFHVRELLVKASPQDNQLIIKIDKHPDLPPSIQIMLEMETGNQRVVAPVTLFSQKEIFPPRHNVYVTALHKDTKVLSMKF